MVKSLSNIFIVLFLFSCSPEKRLARMIKKYPQLITKDTLYYKDTIYIKGSQVDSVFLFNGDTVVIRDSAMIIKYYYNTLTRENYIKGEVIADTIYREKKIPYEKVILKQSDIPRWIKIVLAIIAAMLLLISVKLFFKSKQ